MAAVSVALPAMAKAVHVPRQRSGELILLSRGNTGAGSVIREYRKLTELRCRAVGPMSRTSA